MSHDSEQKPTFVLLHGTRTGDIDALAEVFKALTGREPSLEEREKAQKILDEIKNKRLSRARVRGFADQEARCIESSEI